MADGAQVPQAPNSGAPKQPASPVGKPTSIAGENVFTELFGENVPQGKDLMTSVVEQQEKSGGSLLGLKPKLDESKGKSTVENKKVKRMKPGAMLLQVSIVAVVILSFVLFTQTSPVFSPFGTNYALNTVLAEQRVDKLEAEIHVQKYLSTVLLLDQYVSSADEYFYLADQADSTYNSQNKRSEFKQDAEKLRPELLSLLKEMQDYLSTSAESDVITDAKLVVTELIADLQAKTGEVDEQALLQDIQDLESAQVLMQSKAFRNTILAVDLDAATDEDLLGVYLGYSEVNKSVAAIINIIQEARVDWAYYLDSFESLTKEVDPLFGTEFEGNLEVTDVRFDANGGIGLNGNTITDDSKNFTLISNLLDTYEDSEDFMNAVERSYSKRQEDKNYTGGFKIDMEIETNTTENEG